MEGITNYIYRQVFAAHFGGVDRYYTPFISPNQTESLQSREWKELAPENNQGLVVIPQLLTKMGITVPSFISAAQELVAQLPAVTGSGREVDKVYINRDVDSALTEAENVADSMKDDFVSVEHILLGLIAKANSRMKKLFETYGIHAAEGSPTAEELSKSDEGVVISRSLAERLYGSAKAAIGKEIDHRVILTYDKIDDWVSSSYIQGVVEDVHVSDTSFDTWRVYWGTPDCPLVYDHSQLVIRLKPDVDVRRFVEEQNFRLQQFTSKGLAIVSFTPYEDIATTKNQFASPMLSYDFNLSVATAIFFLINLCLGVIGTFWMQTKRRTEESGIMRAFGATRGRIMGMFLAEGFVLTTLSMIITCILYLNYVKTGLGELCINPQLPQCQPDPTWVADKPLHFCILAGIVYVIICIVVSIGIAIPAWNIVRTKVVKALRDE